MGNYFHIILFIIYLPVHPGALDRHFDTSNAVAVLADTHYRGTLGQQQGQRIFQFHGLD